MANTFHVVPNGDLWAVKKEGNERVSSTHDTQKAAIDAAREVAKEGDDIVIHRADGTIREMVTYSGAARAGNPNGERRDRNDDRPRFHDIWSVGSRVSWSAILAGVAVAMGTAALLTAFAAAIQIPLLDDMSVRGIQWYTAVAAVVVLLAAMFLGGFVASRMTTRETPAETVIYGVLVWATFSALATLGIGAGARLGLDIFNTARAEEQRDQANADRNRAWPGPAPAEVVAGQNPQDAQRAKNLDEAARQGAERVERMSSTAKGWLAFAGLLLPLATAICGALAGCGYDPTRGIRPEEAPPPANVENRINQYERANA